MVMFELTLFPLAFVMLPEVSLDLCMSPFHFNFHLIFAWNFTWSLHFKMGFAIHLERYSVFRLIFLHSMMIFFTFTWNFKMALDPPQFMICFVLSLGIHLKFHLTTRSYHVILTSTWAFHLDFHLIPAVDLVIHLSSSHDISCAQWFLRSQGSQDVPDAEGMPSVCFTFSFPQNMNAKEGTSPVKPVEALVQTYILSFFHCSFNSWIVMNSISTWWLVSLGFPLSHACCHLPHLHFHMLNWHLWSWRCIWHIVHFHFSHVSLASAVHM